MNIKNLYNQFMGKTNSDIREHLPTLIKYGKEVNTITEFGVRWGESTVAWLLSNPEKFTCYDIKIIPRLKNYLLLYDEYAKNNNIDFNFIQADTLEIEIENTDILFIDTLHVYEQLIKELRIHHEKVNKYIILHDTQTYGNVGEDGSKPGLMKAVEELISETEWKAKEVYKNNNGLTILEK